MINESQFFSIGDIPANHAVCIFGPFDSASEGTVWHRARLFGLEGGWVAYFYASDSQGCEPLWSEACVNPVDILLHAFKGRFLWVKLERLEENARIEKIRLYYPAHSFMRYLPAVYQTADLGSFFSRFVAVFQSLYLDIDEKIAGFPAALDPESADGRYLSTLALWLGCEEFALLPDEKKGGFLLKCVEFYKSYGTRSSIENVIGWLYDGEVFVVEYVDFEAYTEQMKITEHFGNDMFLFKLFLLKRDGGSSGLKSVIEAVMDKLKPSYTECETVELGNRVKLDEHTYLGFNSYLT